MGTNVRKLLNLIVISGERRYLFFWKKKFELYVYFTPMKKVIVDYKTYKIKVKDLKLDLMQHVMCVNLKIQLHLKFNLVVAP